MVTCSILSSTLFQSDKGQWSNSSFPLQISDFLLWKITGSKFCYWPHLDELSVGGHDLLCRPRGLRVVTRLKLNLGHHGLTRASLLGRLIHCPNQLVPEKYEAQNIHKTNCSKIRHITLTMPWEQTHQDDSWQSIQFKSALLPKARWNCLSEPNSLERAKTFAIRVRYSS